MKALNVELLNSNYLFSKDMSIQNASNKLPERVIQFGEGNFLRAFVDWMFHELN